MGAPPNQEIGPKLELLKRYISPRGGDDVSFPLSTYPFGVLKTVIYTYQFGLNFILAGT